MWRLRAVDQAHAGVPAVVARRFRKGIMSEFQSKPIHDNKLISCASYDDPVEYPESRYCANDHLCADSHNGRGRKLSYLNSSDVCFACQRRDLQRKMGKIEIAGDLFERKMRRAGLSL